MWTKTLAKYNVDTFNRVGWYTSIVVLAGFIVIRLSIKKIPLFAVY